MERMKLYKYIVKDVKHRNEVHTAYIVPAIINRTLDVYQHLFNELKASFPKAEPENVECLRVVESSDFKGCPIVRFDCTNMGFPAGWTVVEGLLPDMIVR